MNWRKIFGLVLCDVLVGDLVNKDNVLLVWCEVGLEVCGLLCETIDDRVLVGGQDWRWQEYEVGEGLLVLLLFGHLFNFELHLHQLLLILLNRVRCLLLIFPSQILATINFGVTQSLSPSSQFSGRGHH